MTVVPIKRDEPELTELETRVLKLLKYTESAVHHRPDLSLIPSILGAEEEELEVASARLVELGLISEHKPH